MNDTTLTVLLEMQDNATPKMQSFGQSLVDNKAKFRELAMGVRYLGSTFMMLGVAMQASNNETIRGMGSTLIMAGSLMTAVASAAQFISSIGKMIHALKALQIQQILTQALSGPAGWAALAAGAAVAGATVYGISKMQAKASTAGEAKLTGTIENKIYLDGRQIGDTARRQIVLNQQRNATSGIR